MQLGLQTFVTDLLCHTGGQGDCNKEPEYGSVVQALTGSKVASKYWVPTFAAAVHACQLCRAVPGMCEYTAMPHHQDMHLESSWSASTVVTETHREAVENVIKLRSAQVIAQHAASFSSIAHAWLVVDCEGASRGENWRVLLCFDTISAF